MDTALLEPNVRGRGRPPLHPPGPNRHCVRALRLEYGLAQAELAERLGITPSRFCQIERGREPLSKGMAARLALAFGLPSADELFIVDKESESDN